MQCPNLCAKQCLNLKGFSYTWLSWAFLAHTKEGLKNYYQMLILSCFKLIQVRRGERWNVCVLPQLRCKYIHSNLNMLLAKFKSLCWLKAFQFQAISICTQITSLSEGNSPLYFPRPWPLTFKQPTTRNKIFFGLRPRNILSLGVIFSGRPLFQINN